jgi:hypothetical protein
VRDGDGGDPEVIMKLADPFAQVFTNLGIDGAKALIQQQDTRLTL